MEVWQFKDREGEIWDLELDYHTVQEVQKDTGVDLHKADTGEPYKKLEDSRETLVDVISVILTPQINKRGLSAMDFAIRLKGDVLDQAMDALYQAILFYFPPKKRVVLKTILEKLADIQNKEAEIVVERINSPEVAEFLEKKMRDSSKEFSKKLE